MKALNASILIALNELQYNKLGGKKEYNGQKHM